MNDVPENLITTEARAGTTPQTALYVPGIGLVLVVVMFAVLLFVAR